MRKYFSGIENKRLSKIKAIALVLIFIGTGIFGFSHAASAGIFEGITNWGAASAVTVFGSLVGWIVQTIASLLFNFMYVLLIVGNYNQFLASTAVTTGWVVVRDFVNMFFVLVLLAIAIGTILQQQQYHYSQTLPKFLAAAVLVNFSKTICGIAIDAAQVVMMTFMGAISSAGGGNLAALLGIPGLLKVVAEEAESFSGTQAVTGMLVAFFYIVVAFIVVVIMVVMLVIRIVALWFLIILSPAAFFLMSLPNDRGYFSKWLDQFINYLLLGPVMAFFLWLSLTVVASQNEGVNDATQIRMATELGLNLANAEHWTVSFGEVGKTLIGTVGGTAGYVLGIVMLLGSLMAAQQLASVGGGVAGAGAAFAKDWMAGKRGPFSPFRGIRDTLGAYAKIRRQERQQRIDRRAARLAQGVGLAKKLPGQLVRRAGREIYDRVEPVRQVHAALGTASSWVDTWLQRVPGGLLGWGKSHQDRIAERQREATEQAPAARARAAEWRRIAENEDFQAREAQRTGAAPGVVNAFRANATFARAQEYDEINRAENFEARNVRDTIVGSMPRITWEFGKAAIANALVGGMGIGSLGATAAVAGIYGPGVMTDFQRSGESQTLAAAEALDGTMGRLIRTMNQLTLAQRNAVANGTAPGYSALERAAAKIAMSQNGEFDPWEDDTQFSRFASSINAHPVEIARWGVPPGAPAAITPADLRDLAAALRP